MTNETSLLTDAQSNTNANVESNGTLLDGTSNASNASNPNAVESDKINQSNANNEANKTNENQQVDPTKQTEIKPASVAPEKYEDFKMPENIIANPEMISEFSGIAKELNLSQEQAQKLVDLQAKFLSNAHEKTMAEYTQITDGWRKESMEKLGAKAQESLAVAAKAIDRFGSQELRDLFRDTRLGDNYHIIQTFEKIGRLISEDRFVEGSNRPYNADKNAASILYPNQK